jgi:hypothetical protein
MLRLQNYPGQIAFSLTLAAFLVLGEGPAWAGASTCSNTEKWCSHTVATFCQNDGCSSVREEGDCVPKDKSCAEFWCGNRQCQSSWLITRKVCCVYYPAENSPEYACTANELSCPGNTAQMTIRPTLASSQLQELE